jgi:hypothetical protein
MHAVKMLQMSEGHLEPCGAECDRGVSMKHNRQQRVERTPVVRNEIMRYEGASQSFQIFGIEGSVDCEAGEGDDHWKRKSTTIESCNVYGN